MPFWGWSLTDICDKTDCSREGELRSETLNHSYFTQRAWRPLKLQVTVLLYTFNLRLITTGSGWTTILQELLSEKNHLNIFESSHYHISTLICNRGGHCCLILLLLLKINDLRRHQNTLIAKTSLLDVCLWWGTEEIENGTGRWEGEREINRKLERERQTHTNTQVRRVYNGSENE